MYTVNFGFESMTVVPIIKKNVAYALKGDLVIFNAS